MRRILFFLSPRYLYVLFLYFQVKWCKYIQFYRLIFEILESLLKVFKPFWPETYSTHVHKCPSTAFQHAFYCAYLYQLCPDTMMCEIVLAQLETFVHILHSVCFWPRSRSQLWNESDGDLHSLILPIISLCAQSGPYTTKRGFWSRYWSGALWRIPAQPSCSLRNILVLKWQIPTQVPTLNFLMHPSRSLQTMINKWNNYMDPLHLQSLFHWSHIQRSASGYA